MDRGDGGAVERGIKLAPFARRNDRTGGEAERLQHHADRDRIDGEHLADKRDRRLLGPSAARRLHRALLGFLPGIAQHGARQNVLRLRMGRHAKTRHVDADDANAVDFLRQEPQRHAGSRRHAEVRDHDRVVMLGVRELEHGFADVLEQLAGHKRFGIERHIAHGALGAVEMRREGQAVNAAGGARKDGRRPAHAKADAQRAERRAHALRLIVRPLRIILRILFEHLALACSLRCFSHLGRACVAAHCRLLRGALWLGLRLVSRMPPQPQRGRRRHRRLRRRRPEGIGDQVLS